MLTKDFGTNYPGELVSIENGQIAFVPHAIPKELAFSPSTQRLHEQAMLALGELRAVIPSLPNPKLLISPFLRREAVMSSRIEGTRTEVDQLMLFEVSEEKSKQKQTEENIDAREVLNYVHALEGGLEHLRSKLTKPPTGEESPEGQDASNFVDQWLIRSLQKELMSGVRGRDKHPGQYRQCQVFIGADRNLQNARFVPPPPHEVSKLMDEFESFLKAERKYPTLITIAIAHYQFETIHPFDDGNGRVGRLLIMLMLIQYRLLSEPLLYLSAYFERNRAKYYDVMWQVSRRAAWEEWIAFFLSGVMEEAKDTNKRAKTLLSLRETWRSKVQSVSTTVSPLQLIDRLFEFPVIDIPTARDVLEMTYRGAQMAVEKLEELNIVSEVTGQKRNRKYMSRPIVDLLIAKEIPKSQDQE